MRALKWVGWWLVSLVAWGTLVPFTALAAVLAIVRRAAGDRDGRWVSRVMGRGFGRIMVGLSGSRVTIEGAERLEPGKSYIYIANHQSYYDVFALMGYFPDVLRFVTKKELFRIPLFGPGMRAAGHIEVDRGDRERAMTSMEAAGERIRNGVSVLVFAEGTRSRDGRLQPFKKGGFLLSIVSGVPVVPLVVTGTKEILPKGAFRIRGSGDIRVRVLDPVDPASYGHEGRDRFLADVRARMAERLEG